MSTDKSVNKNFVYDFDADRRNKFIALIIFFFSILIFALSVLGFTDSISNQTAQFLQTQLGLTNKWSTSFGPEWFVGLNKDISALGGFPLLPIFFTVAITYYLLREDSRRLWRLIFIVLGGVFIMFIVKLLYTNDPDNLAFEMIIGSVSSFPSGHAMMGTIFYGTLAVTISRRQHSHKTKRLTLITGIVIIALIGICRILPNTHTLNEVVAGWSLGLVWLCTCWFLERYVKKARDRQRRSMVTS